MLQAVRYHLSHLADFSGRDARQTFWYWFLALFILNIVVGLAMSLPATISATTTALEATRNGGDPAAAQAAAMAGMAGSMRSMIIAGIVLGLVNVVLLAAALVRRLHDSGQSGLWAALVGAIYLFSLWQNWSSADQMVEVMRQMSSASNPASAVEAQAQLARQSLLGYVPVVLVIVIGLLRSTPGQNRFGEVPVRF